MEIVAYALLSLCLAMLMGLLVYAIHCTCFQNDRPPQSDKTEKWLKQQEQDHERLKMDLKVLDHPSQSDKAEKRLKQQEQGRAGFEVELKVLNTEVLYCKVEKARTLETSRNKDETTGCEKETQ
jgi:hypothetical protein